MRAVNDFPVGAIVRHRVYRSWIAKVIERSTPGMYYLRADKGEGAGFYAHDTDLEPYVDEVPRGPTGVGVGGPFR